MYYFITTGAVMRSDSIYRADLAHLCHFKITQSKETYPYFVLILRVGPGKTIKAKAQFGSNAS